MADTNEIANAGLPRLENGLSDLVAYGEITYSGRIPPGGPAAVEIAGLLAELREQGWLPAIQNLRTAVAS